MGKLRDFLTHDLVLDAIHENIMRDIRWNAEDRLQQDKFNRFIKKRKLLEKNKKYAVIVSDVIYPKGAYIKKFNGKGEQ